MALSRILARNRPLHFMVAIGVGVTSGTYMFQQPLEQYWKQQQQKAIKAGVHSPSSGSNQGHASKPTAEA